MEKEIDFSECEFINSEMKIYTYYDFCDNRKAIKRLFEKLSRNGKMFYMWYVYSNTHMKLHYKNAIWDYINGYEEDERLLELKKNYIAK